MTLINNLIKIIISTIIIYYFRWLSIYGGTFIFNQLYKIPLVKNNVIRDVHTRVIFEVIIYFVFIMLFYFAFKLISKYIKIDKFYLLIVVISPLLFDITSILYDKSCLKPWYTFDKFIWYFPLRLALWIFLFFYFKDTLALLKSKKTILLITITLVLFHIIRCFHNYYI